MRLIKMFGLASLAAVTGMAFVGATSASAITNTQLCDTHTGLVCGSPSGEQHSSIYKGTVGELLATIDILCLGVLIEGNPLALGQPQQIHSLAMTFSGCGTGSAHNNCTVTVQEQPLINLLKGGLDQSIATATNGRTRLQCSNLGLDCVYDTEGLELALGAGHITANETPITELGGKFFCPDEGTLDGLLELLIHAYALE